MSVYYRSPPIQYLPAFVSAAKNTSFRVAAEELNVTPSAISQQIKILENHVGLALFDRKKRALKLTEAGRDFYQLAEQTMNGYLNGFNAFSERHFSSKLKLSMIPTIANDIVIPRLHDFNERFPDLDLIVETSMAIEDLYSADIDAAIRFGSPPWGGYKAKLISPARSCLVATNAYFDRHPICTVSDIAQHTLIHVRSDVNDWESFMDITGFHFTPKKELHFNSYEAGMKAAEEGLGIAFGVLPISNKAIKDERLTPLKGKSVSIEEGIYLVTKRNEVKKAHYQNLYAWLKEIFSN